MPQNLVTAHEPSPGHDARPASTGGTCARVRQVRGFQVVDRVRFCVRPANARAFAAGSTSRAGDVRQTRARSSGAREIGSGQGASVRAFGECARVCDGLWCVCSRGPVRCRPARHHSCSASRTRGRVFVGCAPVGVAGCDCVCSGIRNADNPRDRVVSGVVWNVCSAVSYSPTPCRVQYHRRWRA